MDTFSTNFTQENEYSPTSKNAQLAYINFLNGNKDLLSHLEIEHYKKICKDIANSSLRAWEASDSFVKESSKLIEIFDYDTLLKIGEIAKELCVFSPMIASNYICNSPLILKAIHIKNLDYYTKILQITAGSGWKDIALTNAFITQTPNFLQLVNLRQIKYINLISKNLSEKSHDLAISFLEQFNDALYKIPQNSRSHFLKLINELSLVSWPDVSRFLEILPQIFYQLTQLTIKSLLLIGHSVIKNDGRKIFEEYVHSLSNFPTIKKNNQTWVAKSALKINHLDSYTSVTFLNQICELLEVYSKNDLAKWLDEGLMYMKNNPEKFDSNAYFNLESTFSMQSLYHHSNVELLERRRNLLEKYCKGLSGLNISILDIKDLIERQIGWNMPSVAATDGQYVYLPNKLNIFNSKQKNFLAYKVYVTHQVSRLEFGSYDYKFKLSTFIKKYSDVNNKTQTANLPLTETQKLFLRFADRRLINYLFGIAEDFRINYLVNIKYPGINYAYQMVKKFELSNRNPMDIMPDREMILEAIIQFTLDKKNVVNEKYIYRNEYSKCISLLNSLKKEKNPDVYKAVNIAVQLYSIISKIPNNHVFNQSLSNHVESLDSKSMSLISNSDSPDLKKLDQNQQINLPQMPDHLGDFKPDLVELITYAKNKKEDIDFSSSGIDQDMLDEFLKETTELNVSGLSDGEFTEYSNLFTNNLIQLTNETVPKQKMQSNESDLSNLDNSQVFQSTLLNDKENEFFYDEWNFRSRDYKPAWCRVVERKLESVEGDYYEQIISEHEKLIGETKRKFEYLKPELMRKEKRLEDGDEIDIDRLVDFYAEKLAGYSTLADFYSKRNKTERDVVVALLLDMSASTDEIIEKDVHSSTKVNQYSGAPGTYFRWLASRNAENNVNTNKRIIDIEKESAIVLSEALDSIGDNYGLYGFSGYGRDNVDFFVIKDIEEKLDQNVQRKIANIQPVRSTRMGPAIRHTIKKLELSQSKVKIMIMLSDGRPQDHEYGKDRTEKAYAIHDTRQALLEAKHKGVTPFLLTVDKDGHDYLQEMCHDIGYEVVSNIDLLPERLTNLYKKISIK